MSETACPTCGKGGFSSDGYMKRHHALVHGESLREECECSAEGCDNVSPNPKFCSFECLGKARREYEENGCAHPDCDEEVYKQKYCSQDCANKESWKNRENPAKRPEVRKKISRKQRGYRNSFYGKTHTKEARERISEASSGSNHPFFGLTGEDHPTYGNVSGLKREYVEETGHTVRSLWEKEIDLMLHQAEINYEYEPETFKLSSGLTYTPDFVVDDIVIEVKGWPDDTSKKRAKKFLQVFPRYTSIVVGNEIPCDIFIAWDEREKLVNVLSEIR
ncbi:MAG: NUMOD3 domain-containing DNA-binding protein [Candidatus Nanohaloarchaea archaeon]|nr:NUMOD3 domain-containing DNA-binding protein [Candidatus Nanohaloarchaea archaeon]